MKRHHVVLNLGVSLALGLSACIPNADPTAPPTPMVPATFTAIALPTEPPATPTTAPQAPTETAAAPGLTADQLRNATYRFTDLPDRPVQLTDGVRPRDPNDPRDADFRIAQGGEAIALGDLDGDGSEDAAVVLTMDPDGTGVFYHLFVMLSNGGQPAQAAEAYLGDRIVLNALTIADREITVEMIVAGPDDGACCPSQPATRRYRLTTDLSLDLTMEENGLAVSFPVDYAGIATGYAVAAQPATPWSPAGDEAPAEFGLSFFGFGAPVGIPMETLFPARIRVYPVRSFAYYGYDTELTALQGLLAQGSPDLSAYANVISSGPSVTLPFLPVVNATQVFRAQPELVTFGDGQGSSGGRGVRYLTFYAQGLMPITQHDVFYTFQGLTADGSAYVSITFPVTIEGLAETAPADFPPPDYTAYLQEQFDIVQNAGNIQPSLSLLDSIVSSIAITAMLIPEQVITIEAPADGAEGVQNGAIVKGTASIWPFEATLVYQVHDGNGTLIGQGPINTVGDIPGPVTFEAPITFTPTQAGIGWIDVLDLSAKDGSVVGADRVEVQLVP